MERAVVHVFQLLQAVLRIIALCNQSTCRENHTVLQVGHTELEVQTVVDFLRDFKDIVAVQLLTRAETNIVALILKLL